MEDQVTFTREDSDRLARIEEHVRGIPLLEERIGKVERKQNWTIGVGTGAWGVVAAFLGLHK